jgi:hypothetical protein
MGALIVGLCARALPLLVGERRLMRALRTGCCRAPTKLFASGSTPRRPRSWLRCMSGFERSTWRQRRIAPSDRQRIQALEARLTGKLLRIAAHRSRWPAASGAILPVPEQRADLPRIEQRFDAMGRRLGRSSACVHVATSRLTCPPSAPWGIAVWAYLDGEYEGRKRGAARSLHAPVRKRQLTCCAASRAAKPGRRAAPPRAVPERLGTCSIAAT